MLKDIGLIFVIETNFLSGSDNVYISSLLDCYFPDFLSPSFESEVPLIKRVFVMADGKGNLLSSKTLSKIKTAKSEFPRSFFSTYVVVCFDVDGIGGSTRKDNDLLIGRIQELGFLPVCFSKNIESVLEVPCPSLNKGQRAKVFSRGKKGYLKEERIRKRLLCTLEEALSNYDCSNFLSAISDLIKKHK